MTPVRALDGSDLRRVARRFEPVVDGGADFAPLHGRLARAVVAGNEQDDTLAAGDRTLEPAVDGAPGLVEVEPVKVDHPVRFDRARPKAPVPRAVERGGSSAAPPLPFGGRWQFRLGGTERRCPLHRLRRLPFTCGGGFRLAGKRTNGCGDLVPELALLSAERAHAKRSPSGSGPGPGPWRTSRPRSAALRRLRPRRCRRGSRP